jgi:hypothetical protein
VRNLLCNSDALLEEGRLHYLIDNINHVELARAICSLYTEDGFSGLEGEARFNILANFISLTRAVSLPDGRLPVVKALHLQLSYLSPEIGRRIDAHAHPVQAESASPRPFSTHVRQLLLSLYSKDAIASLFRDIGRFVAWLFVLYQPGCPHPLTNSILARVHNRCIKG